MNKEDIIFHCFEKKMLLNKEMLDCSEDWLPHLPFFSNSPALILNKESFFLRGQNPDWLEYDKKRVFLEKRKTVLFNPQNTIAFPLGETARESIKESAKESFLNIVSSYQPLPQKHEVQDFTSIFVSRYSFLEKLLRTRQELANVTSINKILLKKEKEAVSLIGLVREIRQTKNNFFLLTIEDLTGQINVIVNKAKAPLFKQVKDLVFDEVIGLSGMINKGTVFADSLVWPEVPVDKELKKAAEESYALFLSDIHVGSTLFLEEEFNKFLDWLNGLTGNETQKEMAQKISYLFIVGDLVDGVGIYPEQDKELAIKDIFLQYQKAAELLKRVPSHIKIIICPGNHDALPLAEPQPPFNPKYISLLLQLPNVVLVSNPATINIGQTETFPGFDVLLYHGYSFDYYVSTVESIRSSGGYSRADIILKFLLKRRHLAPAFSSTPYFPSFDDNLLIKKVPDFFVTGHIHYSSAANYRGITLLSGSCWQSKTNFQEKMGHEPQPARVPIINLKTREIKILKFI